MRGDQPGAALGYGMLDREHLTKHLLELARRDGVANVTMRGLAVEAGTSASSVYYHVAGKAELLDLLIEVVVNSIAVPTDGTWQQRTTELYTDAWRVLVTVPGIAGLLQQRPHTTAAANMDRETRSILRQSGLARRQFGAAYTLLYVYLLGSVELQHYRGQDSVRETARAAKAFRDGLEIILAGLDHSTRPHTQGRP